MEPDQLDKLLDTIRQLNARIEGQVRERSRAEVIRKHGTLVMDRLSGSQIRVIHAVRHATHDTPQGVLLRDLAHRLGVTPPSASVMVDALVKDGFLERRVDASDRRAVRIRLHANMQRHFDDLHNASLAQMHRLTQAVGEKTIRNWLDILQRIEAILNTDLTETERS